MQPTELTELQRSRIRFHLGYTDNSYSRVIEYQTNLLLDFGLSPSVLFQAVGEVLELPSQSDRYTYLGEDLCQIGSHLHKCEVAYSTLDAGIIDPTLAYKQVGSVDMRRDEVQARDRLYRKTRGHLALLLGVDLHELGAHGYRVGY